MSTYHRIQGFTPPAGVPADFADQIRNVIWKYNRCINDLLAAQKKVAQLETSLDEQQTAHEALQTRYVTLEEMARQVADDYEELLNHRNTRVAVPSPKPQPKLAQPKALTPTIKIDDDDEEIGNIIADIQDTSEQTEPDLIPQPVESVESVESVEIVKGEPVAPIETKTE